MSTTTDLLSEYNQVIDLKSIIFLLNNLSNILEKKNQPKSIFYLAIKLVENIINTSEKVLEFMNSNDAKDISDMGEKIRLYQYLVIFAEKILETADYEYERPCHILTFFKDSHGVIYVYEKASVCATVLDVNTEYNFLFDCVYCLSKIITELEDKMTSYFMFAWCDHANAKKIEEQFCKLDDSQEKESQELEKKLKNEKLWHEFDLSIANCNLKMFKTYKSIYESIDKSLDIWFDRVENHFDSIVKDLQNELRNPIDPSDLTLLEKIATENI